MKKLLLVLAALVLFATTTVPSFADGNPWPLCTNKTCTNLR
jgi:hypothetical protein